MEGRFLGEIGVSALVSRAIPSVTGVLKSASAPSLSLAPLLGRFRLSTRQAERPESVRVPDNRGVVLLLEPQRVADLSLPHLLAIEGSGRMITFRSCFGPTAEVWPGLI
jgi:hypothetical protein